MAKKREYPSGVYAVIGGIKRDLILDLSTVEFKQWLLDIGENYENAGELMNALLGMPAFRMGLFWGLSERHGTLCIVNMQESSNFKKYLAEHPQSTGKELM